MQTGTTTHTERNFEPADYKILDYLDNRRPQYFGQGIDAFEEEVKFWEADMQRAIGDDWRRKCGQCVHCHNGNVRYITVALHVPTNERVVFGCDCTERLQFANRNDFKIAQLKKRAEARNVSFRIWKQREAFVQSHPSIARALEAIKEPVHAGNHFVADVLRKLNQYGSLSDRQVSAVEQSLARDLQAVERKAVEAAEVKGDAPEGRQTVTGEVLSVQARETAFGYVTKMLVKLANNSKVWVTVPAGEGVERGATITFAATFERSRDDRSFGFGKRPHLHNVQSAATVGEDRHAAIQ